MRRLLVPSLAITALTVLTVLAGCSGETGGAQVSGPAQDVASISTPAAPPATGGGGAQAGRRPQATLDTTDEETARWWQTFLQCLVDNGVPISQKPASNGKPGTVLAPDNNSMDRTKYAAQYAKCAQLEPLQPPELDPRTNPRYMDSYRAMINCFNQRGLKVTPLPNGGGWNYDGPQTLSAEQQSKVQFECQKEAFSGDL
ncbi:hypothetical protein ALI144C_09675 [Actinosynnema sp. ALI-1.44]|uniref:hypothetical protein n=1 Tax=Actinosynnema sp. ALI-1.44 TaxID=1933779 RepID=UPI0009CBEAA9|nr:hypothetical protein [Actinosynnema sp. ALI-1.44]ONI86917.1 hypothetical protein ALI144C_09675 [Actinosynnema sp. ALI-1.44]